MSDHTPFFPENLDDYAPWVAKHGLVAPYGECQCGCGQDVSIAIRSRKEHGWRVRHPRRFISGHFRAKQTLGEAFWQYVEPKGVDECWVWSGYTHRYGYFHFKRKDYAAHRVSWEIHNGPIPKGMFVCHTCDNPPCCNPRHLFLGTIQDNHADMVAKGRNPRGESHPAARLSESEVHQIRVLFASGLSQAEIGRMMDASSSAIRHIVRGERWKHTLPLEGRDMFPDAPISGEQAHD